ncbi:MAG TPA: bacterial transcriptional activator domain-containing protein [Nocardioides sp.]|nr:bacterial transcriptional activator domain-containing protein [Nocardioides sp.]
MEIRMLGPLLVRRHDGSGVRDDEWRTSKTLDLLRLLALHNGEAVPVRTIVDLLWPGVAESRGRASLRTAASQLRKALGEDCVERRIGGLVLVDSWVDVQTFEGLLTEAATCARVGDHQGTVAAVKHAEALWVGDLDLPEHPGEWMYEARERLHRLRCRALLDAAEAAAAVCWMRDSLAFAERAASLAPSEEASRALMRALAGVGEIEKALEIFERTRRDLAREYGADPSPQTRALHVQLMTGTAAPTRRGETIGHAETVVALRDVLETAAREDDTGQGTLVWLEGEPGSGRDSVTRAACRAAGLGLHELGREIWFGHAADLMPAVADASPSDVVLLPASTTVQPGSLTALESLVRRHGGLVVVPVRQVPVDGWRHPVVRVGALPDADLADLTELVLQGTPSASLLDRLRAASGGLSGAACRTAQAWLAEGRVVWSVDGLALTDKRVPYLPSASLCVRRRLRMLSPYARDAVEVLAVVDDETDPDEIVAVVCALHGAATPDEVRAALEQLVETEHVVAGRRGYRLLDQAVCTEFATWMRSTVRRRLSVLVAEHVSLPLVQRVELLAAAGEHDRAVQLGGAAFELARQWGDTVAEAALRSALSGVPAHRRQTMPEDRPVPEPRGPAVLEGSARASRTLLDRLQGFGGLAMVQELEPLALLLGA